MPLPVQTGASLADCIQGAKAALPSVYLPHEPIFAAAARENMASVDESLGQLFSYIEEHYRPDEYLVTLYSDHGVSVLSKNHYIVSPDMTHAVWMMRGAGVPEGTVTDELTSAVDIYPTLAHLLGFPVGNNVDGVLPQLFGGRGRKIAYSNSLYPGRTYCLRARSQTSPRDMGWHTAKRNCRSRPCRDDLLSTRL